MRGQGLTCPRTVLGYAGAVVLVILYRRLVQEARNYRAEGESAPDAWLGYQ